MGHVTSSFLSAPPVTAAVQALHDDDVDDVGYVMNATHVWSHQPQTLAGLFELLGRVGAEGGFTLRERGILVAATAASLGDSYCALAWGAKLSAATDPTLAAGVIGSTDEGLTPCEHAMATWARAVAADPNGTTAADVQALRDTGFDDPQIFAMTTFVALRIAFSTVNDALGAAPDAGLRHTAPAEVQDAVTFGRPVATPDTPA
jgi:alkylhydroperoxidase family enzyme